MITGIGVALLAIVGLLGCTVAFVKTGGLVYLAGMLISGICFFVGAAYGFAQDKTEHEAFCRSKGLSDSYYSEGGGKTAHSVHFCYDKDGRVFFLGN